MVPIILTRMVCRLTLLHCCAGACFSLICCSVALASCCSGRVSSQYLTSMSWTSQRKGCIACMSLWWLIFVSTGSWPGAGSKFICWKVWRHGYHGSSHWGKVLLATCAGKTRLGWAIRVSLPIPGIMMFPPKLPLFKVWMMSLEQC